MSWKEDLGKNLKAYTDTEFDYIQTKDIREAEKINCGSSGIYMEASVIYFTIKNIHYILHEHGRRKAVQGYKMFKEVLSVMAERSGGFVNCFCPTGFLIVYPGDESVNRTAIENAMKISYAIDHEYRNLFSFIPGLEFAMGIDHGHIMGTKTQNENNHEGLTWFGSCIYKAESIAKECARPFYVGITSTMFHALDEDLRVVQRHILGVKKTVDIWAKVSYQYNNEKKHLYQTNHKLSIDDEK